LFLSPGFSFMGFLLQSENICRNHCLLLDMWQSSTFAWNMALCSRGSFPLP
jgi:hypothetical protein